MNYKLKRKLISLGLEDFVNVVEENESNILNTDKTFDERIYDIASRLEEIRNNNRITRLIANANFKYKTASVESVDCSCRSINKETLNNLAKMKFLLKGNNINITGYTGSGKTYLACALGVEACKQGYRTYYITMQNLFKTFDNLQDKPRKLKEQKTKFANYKLLIIDEWLMDKPNEKELRYLYELIDSRLGNSNIFVSQFDPSEWYDKLGGGIKAESILDRILHIAYPIPSAKTNIREKIDTQILEELKKEIEVK